MWYEENDNILKILNCIVTSKEAFPVICPICGKKECHIYMHRHGDGQRGGLWIWCSSCRYTSHSSYRIPSWWKNLERIDESKLVSLPDYLEENKINIDKWVNKLRLADHDC